MESYATTGLWKQMEPLNTFFLKIQSSNYEIWP